MVLLILGFAIGFVLFPLYKKIRQIPTVKDLEPFSQKNPKFRDKLFMNAQSSVIIVTGCMHKYFKQQSFRKAVKDAVDERGVQIDIVCGPEIDGECSTFLDLVFDNGSITLYQLPFMPLDHFRIVDKKELFIEERHKLGEESMRVYRTTHPRLINDHLKIVEKLKEKAQIATEKGNCNLTAF